MRFLAWVFVLLVVCQSAVWALDPRSGSRRGDPDPQIPIPPQFLKPLPELKGVVSWKTLAEVTPVKQKDRFVPQFSPQISSLDKKEVRLQGFMLPLDLGEKQKHFILSSTPPSCAFCLPGGPDAIVEVKAKAPIKYGFEPVVLTGRFTVLRDDPTGLYYRLTDAVVVAR